MSLDFYLEQQVTKDECVYDRNITHNLGGMALDAGVYYCLWRADDLGPFKAKDIISTLEIGLKALKKYPEEFKKRNPENGWGNYDNLVSFVESTLMACKEYPEANVRISG